MRNNGLILNSLFFTAIVNTGILFAQLKPPIAVDLASCERERVLRAADRYLQEQPVTITAIPCDRSAGGRHDYYSEADYWWPDPQNPGGPYIQRDGLSNPDNFTGHRQLVWRLSQQVPALTAAYLITGKEHYARKANEHLHAWFVDSTSRMNPHLLYAQAIKGRVTGRGIGIIDTIHLVEVAQAVLLLAERGALPDDDLQAIKNWFQTYLDWLFTHAYGIAERDNGNNHSTCWALQVAAYGRLVNDQPKLSYCRDFFRTVLIPNQVAVDGSMPRELKRTKPYCYTLFNADVLALVCQILSTPTENLWQFATPDGRGMARVIEFILPFIRDKTAWPFPPDVMYFEFWPVRHPVLLLGGLAYQKPEYIALWKTLPADPQEAEVIRNFPIRQPLLWIN